MKIRYIVLIVLGVILMYCLPFMLLMGIAFVVDGTTSFEKVDETYVVGKGKVTIDSLSGIYDTEKKVYILTGELHNKSKSDIDYANIDFSLYDNDGNSLGQAYGSIGKIKKDKSWKFNIIYEDINASEVVSFELDSVDYN